MRLYTPLILASTATALSGGFGGAAKTKKKKKSAAPLVEESEAYTKLRKWATDGGATLDGVRESNGALVATKDIKKNGVLATLPSDLALALCDPDEDEADHENDGKAWSKKWHGHWGDYEEEEAATSGYEEWKRQVIVGDEVFKAEPSAPPASVAKQLFGADDMRATVSSLSCKTKTSRALCELLGFNAEKVLGTSPHKEALK